MDLAERHEKLMDFLESRDKMPFEWGKNDCFTFSLEGMKALGGPDETNGYVGRYDSLKGALKVIKMHEGETFLEVMSNGLKERGIKEVEVPIFGDLVCVKTYNPDEEEAMAFEHTFGIMCHHGLVAMPGKNGTVYSHQYKLVRGWRI